MKNPPSCHLLRDPHIEQNNVKGDRTNLDRKSITLIKWIGNEILIDIDNHV
jgi:hypothetical protein